jgi:hypothetical protein
MPSVHNKNEAPSLEEASPVVLFQMMNYYKRRMELAEAQCESERKRMRVMRETHAEQMAHQQHLLHEQIAANREFAIANRRGAEMIITKHHAGMRIVSCLDDLLSAVDLVRDTFTSDFQLGLEYINGEAHRVRGRAEMALELFTRAGDEEADEEIDLTVYDEIIDLTGDTTEEEREEEDEEAHPEEEEEL